VEATKTTQKQNTETRTLKKLTETLNIGSNIASQTGDDGWLKASRKCLHRGRFCALNSGKPPAGANKYTYAEKWTAAQSQRSDTRSNIATPSLEKLKKDRMGKEGASLLRAG